MIYPAARRFRWPPAVSGMMLLALLNLSGCTPPDQPVAENRPLLMDDLVASRDLARIRQTLISKSIVSNEDFARLQQLNQRYPRTTELVIVLAEAYVIRQDWIGLCEFYAGLPPEFRNAKLHTESLIKAGRYDQAIELLRKLATSDAGNPQWELLLAHALYQDGQLPASIEILDRLIPLLSGSQRVNAWVLRGMAALQQDQLELADTMLSKAVAVEPANIAALNAYSRALRLRGEPQKAREIEQQAQRARNDAKQKEVISRRLGELSAALEDAWSKRQFSRCKEIIAQMMQDADPQLQQKLNQFLVAIQQQEQ